MAGNILGVRRYYAYTSDTGEEFKYQTDEDLGTAIGATLNDTNPDFPKRFKPRGVYCKDSEGRRKFIVCPTVTNSTYAAEASVTLSIDEVDFKTTGRVGEKRSFGSNPATGS